MASYWRPDMKLDPSLPWELVLEETGRSSRYVARCGDQAVILDRVTSVLSDVYGAGEELIIWSIRQTLLDLLAFWIPGATTEEQNHLDWLVEVQRELDRILEAGSTTTDTGRKKIGKKWSFKQLCHVLGLKYEQAQPFQGLCWESLGTIFDDAQNKARYRTLDKASQLGTRAHELIEIWTRSDGDFSFIGEDGERYRYDITKEDPAVQNAIKAFFGAMDTHDWKPLCTEVRLLDVEQGIAGTADAFFKDEKGRTILVDWKTSSGIYNKQLIQCGFYGDMASRSAIGEPHAAYIFRFDKKTAAFEIYPVWRDRIEFLRIRQVARMTLLLYRWGKEASKQLFEWSKTL